MQDGEEEPVTYHTSRTQKGLALACIAALFLLAALGATGLGTTGDGPSRTLSLINFALTGSMLLAAAVYGLRATIRISEDTIRKTKPLWSDPTIRFGSIKRAHLTTTTEALWLYTDTSLGADPALTIEAASFERFETLVLHVIEHLPSDAEVRDPAGRVEEYRRGNDDGDSDGRSGGGRDNEDENS